MISICNVRTHWRLSVCVSLIVSPALLSLCVLHCPGPAQQASHAATHRASAAPLVPAEARTRAKATRPAQARSRHRTAKESQAKGTTSTGTQQVVSCEATGARRVASAVSLPFESSTSQDDSPDGVSVWDEQHACPARSRCGVLWGCHQPGELEAKPGQVIVHSNPPGVIRGG